MPIYDIHFRDNVFYAREVGYVSKQEADAYVEQLRQAAEAAAGPLATLVDAREVTFISVEARMIFARASSIRHVKLAAIVTDNPVTAQYTRMIELMSPVPQAHVFRTMEDAHRFIAQHLGVPAPTG